VNEERTKEQRQADGEAASRWVMEAVAGYMRERGFDQSSGDNVAKALTRMLVESIFLLVVQMDIPAETIAEVCEHVTQNAKQTAQAVHAVTTRGGDA